MEWGVRIVLAAFAAVLGYGAVSNSFAYHIRTKAPERAYALAPWDGRLAGALSERMSGPEASPADRIRADDLARAALRHDPMTVAAIGTLGINAQIRGNVSKARQWFGYSERMSRRDLRTRLWAIEDSVGRGDIPGALRNYDIALRTSRNASLILFPVLSLAISDDKVRASLAQTLRQRPMWSDAFLGYVPGNASDPRATADLFGRLKRHGIQTPEWTAPIVINRLIAGNHNEEAWDYYAAITPGAERRVSRDPRFIGNRAAPTPFDWVPLEEAGISSSIQRGEKGGIFDFAAPPSVGGPLLRQMQMLPPGDYLVEGRSSGLDQPEESRPYWSLTCIDGREFGRVDLPNSDQDRGRFSGKLTLPAGCPLQYLSLFARPSDLVGGGSGQIQEVQLRPLPQ